MLKAVLVKIGGGLGNDLGRTREFVSKLREAAKARPIVLFPGGGPFADIVRDIDRKYDLGDDTAHWMAIHAMDSFGLLLSETCPGVATVAEIIRLRVKISSPLPTLPDGLPEIPLWLPYRWLRHADPSPHSWGVTSDSLAVLGGAYLGVEWVGLAKATDHLADHLPFASVQDLTTGGLRDLRAQGANWAVDEYLPEAIDAGNVRCKLIDARNPGEAVQLLVEQGNAVHVTIRPK